MSHLKNKPASERKQAQQFLDQELTEQERTLLGRHFVKAMLVQPVNSTEDTAMLPLLKKLVTMMQMEDKQWLWVTHGGKGYETVKFKSLESWTEYQVERYLPGKEQKEQSQQSQQSQQSSAGSHTESVQDSPQSNQAQLAAPQNQYDSPDAKQIKEEMKHPDTMEKIQRIENSLKIARKLEFDMRAS